MITALLALIAGVGTHLTWTALALGRRGLGPPSMLRPLRRVRRPASIRPGQLRDLALITVAAALLPGLVVWTATASPAFATAVSVATGCLPLAAWRHRQRTLRATAHDEWPRLVEELRVLTGSAGRSIPQALFEVGTRAPALLQPGFEAARREWQVTTDLERTLAVLKDHLADASVDATCETLLVAHEVGGSDLDNRLRELAADRRLDVQERKEARARQAGVRFARRFVLLVPLGMAVAGMGVGSGRAAYATPLGQTLAVWGVGLVAACWAWAGRLLRLPEAERVFP